MRGRTLILVSLLGLSSFVGCATLSGFNDLAVGDCDGSDCPSADSSLEAAEETDTPDTLADETQDTAIALDADDTALDTKPDVVTPTDTKTDVKTDTPIDTKTDAGTDTRTDTPTDTKPDALDAPDAADTPDAPTDTTTDTPTGLDVIKIG